MSTLTILTTNPEKQAQARVVFQKSGFEIEFVELETPELQAFTCEEVAIASAKFAFEKLRKPVVVTDAGYFIKSLNGFPGPFLKYINEMLKAEDILRAMADKSDRTIELIETIAYFDGHDGPITFTSTIPGTIARDTQGIGRVFDQLFIPDGEIQTSAELGKGGMHAIYVRKFTHWNRLKSWLQEQKF